MSKKRTKADKRKASQARRGSSTTDSTASVEDTSKSQATFKTSQPVQSVSTTKKSVNSSVDQSPLPQSTPATLRPIVRTEPRLIKQDIAKSLLVTAILLALLLGITVATRYNLLNLPFFP